MTLDQIDRMVRQANPVPDLTALEPVDVPVLDQQRRTEMQTHDRIIVDQQPEKPRRNLLIGIAAAAAIIIGALLLWRPLTDETPVADGQPAVTEATEATTASAVDTATAFFEAYAAFDIDRAGSYLVGDAMTEFGGDLEAMRLQSRFDQAHGSQLLLDTCEERDSAVAGTVVRCSYDYHAIRSDEIGLGPFTGNWYDFNVQEGRIVAVTAYFDFMNNGFSGQMWEPFALWIRGAYPEDVLTMYTAGSQTMNKLTEESIALWEQRSREYVEVVQQRQADAVVVATSFIDAFFSFDVDLAASYLAPDGDLSNFELDGASWQMNNRLMEAWAWKVFLDSCEATGVEVIGVICPFATQTLRSDEMGLGPFGDNTFDITVEDGQVVSAAWRLAYMTNGFNRLVWQPFAAWIRANHPEDGPVLYANWPAINLEAVTEESIVLWEQRSREYVEAVLAGQ